VYVFSFLVFCISPFIWLTDLLAIGNVLNLNSVYFNLFLYKELSLVISFVLLFSGIIFVLLTNETIRKQKVDQKSKADKVDYWKRENPTENIKLDSLKTSNLRENKNKTILRLYALIVILSWGLVLETFSDSDTFGQKVKNKHVYSEFAKTIAWLLNGPKKIMNRIDDVIHEQMDPLTGVSPMVKAFCVYFVTFIALFFGLFIRIPLGLKGVNYNKIRVANMENIFGPTFFRNIDQNRNVAIFFTCWFLSFILLGFINWLQSKFFSFGSFLKIIYFLLVILIFGLFFGYRKLLDARSVQLLVMFLLSLLCAALGTPILVGIIQLFLEISGRSLTTNLFESSGSFNIINFVFSIPFLTLVLFIFLFALVMSLGKQWIQDDAYKRIQIFNAILVCMAVSLFMGLATTYNMFTHVFNIVRFILEGLFVFFVPLLIVLMSIVLFVYSFKSYQKGLVMTDG